ncbi:adenylate/guanylate cyclase domain-containing protein [Nostoc sp.]|uniref:adenylate/guanylate cyclase domain-containing protein n=1 Tax=Nostoc sp. TaxID=1180 RepID=UPI002FF138AD
MREFKAITWQTTYTPSVGLPGRIWIRRLPLWIQDITEDGDKRRSQPAAEAGLHAAFGFPILDDSEILGVMVFFSRDVQLKDKELLQMMGSIGSQIAQFIKRKQAENAFNTENNQNLNLRIGIHSGSVVARVIDLNKFTYDLWGDTINIASCMESQGIVGKIQVTENTYKSLRNEFLFEKRGEIEVQGKGKMTTYFLIGQKG